MSRLRKFRSLFALLLLHVIVGAAAAEDRALPHDPQEPEFTIDKYPRGLKENDLEHLPIDDPKLRQAYGFLAMSANSGGPVTDERNPEMVVVLNDVKRRGDSTTPVWLDLMAKNPNSFLECYIPGIIARIGNIEMEPYVEYLRKMLTSRPDEINGAATKQALAIFFQFGTGEDVKMVQEVAKKRPFLAWYVEDAFAFEALRNPAGSKPSRPAKARTPGNTADPEFPEKASTAKPARVTLGGESVSSVLWSAMAVLVVTTAAGLLWLRLKGRN